MERILQKGFTLLELLMVVAIIGIIIAIAMVSLNQSKDKGGDAGVKNNLVNARPQAEVYYTNQNSSYEGVCNSTSGIFKQMQAARRAYGGALKASYTDTVASTWNTEECHDSGAEYAAWVPLKASTAAAPRGWCIDSRNISRTVTAVLPANSTQCP